MRPLCGPNLVVFRHRAWNVTGPAHRQETTRRAVHVVVTGLPAPCASRAAATSRPSLKQGKASSRARPRKAELEEGSVKRLATLSWKARGSGGTCTAEVDQPIRGYKLDARTRSNPFAQSEPDGTAPTVSWISFDGDTYWVRLSASRGWPRTIRITQSDVDGAKV